ncbi:MAG: erythromycin esterase family protein [Pseudomonadota bacterium]
MNAIGLWLLLFCTTVALAQAPETGSAWARLRAEASRPLVSAADLTPLVEAAGARRLVLLGESTHGSHEFYAWRAAISRRLVAEQRFNFVAVEADWPSLMPLDAYVRGLPGAPPSAAEALAAVTRWPAWLWRNQEFAEFAEWLHGHNASLPMAERVALRGMDVYGPELARRALLAALVKQDADLAAALARDLECMFRHGEDGLAYARALAEGATACDTALAAAEARLKSAASLEGDADLVALMRALRNAEAYYRASSTVDGPSWNVRVGHMWETLADLLDTRGRAPKKGIVWAHNSHVGDAWYTALAWNGLQNIGQLSRQSLGIDNVFIVGFATTRGQTWAAPAWGEPPETMTLPTALPETLDAQLAGPSSGYFLFGASARESPALNQTVYQRGIGVVYLADLDSAYYLPCRVPWRFDALLFVPDTRPLTLLEDVHNGP